MAIIESVFLAIAVIGIFVALGAMLAMFLSR